MNTSMLRLVFLTNLLKNDAWSCFIVLDVKVINTSLWWVTGPVMSWLLVHWLAQESWLVGGDVCFAIIGYWKDLFRTRTCFISLKVGCSEAFFQSQKYGPGFQSQKYGMPIYTSIIKFCAVCFWICDNQRYSKTSYISMQTKSMLGMLYYGLSHVQL